MLVVRRTHMKQALSRAWRFHNAVCVNWNDCVRASPEDQNYTVIPVSAHIGVIIHCRKCGIDFDFSANEQRVWYEKYRFWIDSVPVECAKCRAKRRHVVELNARLSTALSIERKGIQEFNEMVLVLNSLLESGVDIGPKLRQKFRMALKRCSHPDASRLLATMRTPN